MERPIKHWKHEQRSAVDELTQIVRATKQFQKAEAAERLIKIATGDGVALVFYTSPEAPVRCAVELSRALKDHPHLRVRMGIHSGPVRGVVDVTGRTNLAGADLNLARRVMDCETSRSRLRCWLHLVRRTTAHQMGAHRKSDQIRDDLCAVALRKRSFSVLLKRQRERAQDALALHSW